MTRLKLFSAVAALAALMAIPGQAQARPKLATLLWGDRSEVQAVTTEVEEIGSYGIFGT